MDEKTPELRVIDSRKDGRRKFDEQSKRALVEACLKPGVSVARMAQTHGVNANLLRKWIARYLIEREQASKEAIQQDHARSASSVDDVCIDVPARPASDSSASKTQPAFVPIVTALAALTTSPQPKAMAVALHVRLPNGVEFDLAEANVEELATIVQMLGRMPCSGSTTA
ncbi:transposase [Cupriavidus basilensis]